MWDILLVDLACDVQLSECLCYYWVAEQKWKGSLLAMFLLPLENLDFVQICQSSCQKNASQIILSQAW